MGKANSPFDVGDDSRSHSYDYIMKINYGRNLMNKQASLNDIKQSAFNDELEKIAAKVPYRSGLSQGTVSRAIGRRAFDALPRTKSKEGRKLLKDLISAQSETAHRTGRAGSDTFLSIPSQSKWMAAFQKGFPKSGPTDYKAFKKAL